MSVENHKNNELIDEWPVEDTMDTTPEKPEYLLPLDTRVILPGHIHATCTIEELLTLQKKARIESYAHAPSFALKEMHDPDLETHEESKNYEPPNIPKRKIENNE